jgi:ribosomal protein S18 acetylase RimI-like enzyme
MKIKYTEFLKNKHRMDLLFLYKDVWWGGDRTIYDIDRILEASFFYVAFIDQEHDKLIAFSRIICDGFKFAYIYDLMIDSNYSAQKLGTKLMKKIIKHPKLQYITYLELVCKRDMISFYNKFNFSTDYGELVPMRLKKN